MGNLINRPGEIRINAWDGQASPADALPTQTPWGQRKLLASVSQWLAPTAPADERDWKHPDVGWGVVLPDNDQISAVEKARGDDLPQLRKLLDARAGAPILRWRPELQQAYLRRYYPDGSMHDLSAQAPNTGIAKGRIPQYLLIVGSPKEIPWAVQYALNMSNFVGRLDLPPDGLKNYTNALINGWSDQTTQPRAPVIWSVDHGQPDITWLMARAIAGKLWDQFEQDKDFTGRVRLNDDQATGTALVGALIDQKPSLIVTTSHGMTGPLDDPELMKSQLGVPVDAQHRPVSVQQFNKWNPSGAIWYAHACCSAGSDQRSRYFGFLPDNGSIGLTLSKIAAAVGAIVSPLATALLGAEKPLRAFIGHVEPTFDWTLRDPVTKQVVTHVLCKALYDRLYQQDKPTPIGFALKDVYKEAGHFYGAWQKAIDGINQNMTGARDEALYRQLVAMDRQTLVILGDPTVTLPPIK